MGQPYRRKVSDAGGLSAPVLVGTLDMVATASEGDNEYTFVEAAQLDIIIEENVAGTPADILFQVATDDTPTWGSWIVGKYGVNTIPSTCYGVRFKNRTAAVAKVNVSRYSA